MEIKSVVMNTNRLKQMKNFYVDTLGFSLLHKDAMSFRISVGTSELEFSSLGADNDPYYHFAFNIPSNKFKEAKLWAQERITLPFWKI